LPWITIFKLEGIWSATEYVVHFTIAKLVDSC